jgi:hypothetical protein
VLDWLLILPVRAVHHHLHQEALPVVLEAVVEALPDGE